MKYRVGIIVSGYYETEVEANSEQEAIDIACEESYSEAEYDYSTEFCYRVEEDEEDVPFTY